MPQSHGRWTLEMVHALPDDGNRYEVIDGELFVTPAPTSRHQRAAVRLYRRLEDFAAEHSIELLPAPCDVLLPGDGVVQPDLLAFWRAHGTELPDAIDINQLVLAVEILSPGTARVDRQTKRDLYQSNGVGEYWIVDLHARVIERWRPDDSRPEVASTSLLWQPGSAGDTLRLDVEAYFRDALA